MSKDLKYTLSLRDLFSKVMKKAEGATHGMDNTMSSLQSKLATLGAGIGLSALGKSMVETGAKFDSYKVQLETILGSQKKASDAFNKIKEDAEKTPFNIASLMQANTMLLATGVTVDEARSSVLGLANAIAATGGGNDELSRMAVNLQQIKTLGKASALDVKQFAYANIPIYQMLSKSMGKTIEQLRESEITYDQLIKSFDVAAKKGGMFANGLDKQSKSVAGLLSNLGDKATNTLVSFYDRLKPLIISVISLLSKLLNWVSENKETVIFFGKMILLIGAITMAYKTWVAITGALKVAQLALNLAMLLNPIGIVILAIGALTVAVGALIFNYQRLKQEYMSDIQKRKEASIKNETNAVNNLSDRYLKLGLAKNKSDAFDLAKKEEMKSLLDKEKFVNGLIAKNKYGTEKNSVKNLALKQQLTDIAFAKTALLDPESKSNYLQKNTTPTTTAGVLSNNKINSGVNLTAQRPQSLVININEMVHDLKIQASNLTESTAKIKEEVSKIFLEIVNDANLAVR